MHLGNDLSRCLYPGGGYEPNEFMFLSQALQPEMTLIDVGANDGLYTLFAAKPVASTGRVVASALINKPHEALHGPGC